MQMYQQFHVDIEPLACNFIEIETPAQVFTCEFFDFFQPVILFKRRIHHRCFLLNFEKFFSLQLY